MSKYPVIVFEGIEASGKSTSLKKIIKYLKTNKIKYVSFREPGGTNLSEKLRSLMLNKKSALSNKTDLFLLMASRSENVDKILKKNYKKKVILIDRFIDSTLAYQVYGKKVSLRFINNIHKQILGKIKPDITFVLKVKKNSFLKRLRKRKTRNRYDNFPVKFYIKAQNAFIKLSRNKKDHIVLDSSENTTLLQKKIFKIIKNKIGTKRWTKIYIILIIIY